ncbi:MAG: tryptophan synthase subunit alpha, partial [Ardenticatenaceae bacterium]
IYLISLMGVTGERGELSAEVPGFVARVRQATSGTIPLALGFGISSPESAREAGKLVDGVIVGSALGRRLADPATAEAEARAFTRALRAALENEAGDDT